MMTSPAESDSENGDTFFSSEPSSDINDQNVRQQQQRLQALLEAAGINTRGVDGALLSNPSVLDHLSSSVNKALMDAKRAMKNVNMEHELQPPPFTFSESLTSISSLSCGESSYETLRNCLCDMSDDDYYEYLTQACSNGYYELVYVLIDLDQHLPDHIEHDLIRKIHSQFQNIMVSKLQMTADDRNGNKGEMTPLMEAAYNGFTDIVTLLIDHGYDINKKSSTGNTALMYACCGGFEHIVHNLLCAGANTEIFNENGHTPLMEAASGGHVNCAKLLVNHGAEINCASNEFKESALTLACYKGNYDMVDFLLSAGADREHKTDEMHTALMEASMDGHTDVARLLLDSGCNVNMPQDSFESPLTLAACGGHFDLAKLLIDRGANLEEVNDEGYTALMEAAREGHEKVVKVLIDAGADVNQQTEETQETALTLACCAGFIDVAKLLIEASANIEKGASTPLMEAAQEGYEKLVDYLIESGGKVTTVATNGDTALDLAAENGHTKICAALLTAGANLEHVSEGGRTPIMRAARQGHEETVEFLVKAGSDLNRYSENNEHTVLSFACYSGHLQVVKLLLQHGSNPNATLKDGSTMLIEAAKGGHTAVVTLLLDYSKHPNIISKEFETLQFKHQQSSQMQTIQQSLINDQTVLGSQIEQNTSNVSGEHVQTLDQLATDAREAQIRLEALELKIKNAFESKQISDDMAPDTEGLTNEIAQIQKEKKQKQKLMSQLQKVEQEIHQKMVQRVNESIAANPSCSNTMIDSATRDETDDNLRSCLEVPLTNTVDNSQYEANSSSLFKYNESMDYQKQFANNCTTIVDQEETIKNMLGYPLNGSDDIRRCLDMNSTRKEWGFTPTEFSEIMKHIQVLGPAIQKAIQRHLSQGSDTVSHPDHTRSLNPPDDAEDTVEKQPSEVTIRIKNEDVKEDYDHEAPRDEVPVYFDNINDKTESNHDTPLTLACQGGHTELVQLLVSRGADLEHRDKKGFTPLILSATGGFSEICEILLDAGADIEAQSDRTKDTPLSLACSGGKKEVVELLLSRVAKKEHRNVSDYTPLSLAASGGYIDIIKILLDAGAEINSRTASKLGISPLMLAAMNGHLEAVTLLLDRGADINAQIETNKNTALTLACFQGRSEVVATLLDRRANVEHRAKTGLTPLMEAASGGYIDVGRVLLEKGADVNAPPVPSSRDTALTIASDKGHKMFVELVLNWGAHVDTKNKKGNTPIWLSCNSGHLDVLQKLIDFGGDPTIPDARNCSPLMASFKKGHVKVVKYLVKKVTQFPSDQECYNYIQSIKEKDPELRMRCAQCVETIITAKERQEKEANKHADMLLREIETEKQRKLAKVKQKKMRSERKKEKKYSKSGDDPNGSASDLTSEHLTDLKPIEEAPLPKEQKPAFIKNRRRVAGDIIPSLKNWYDATSSLGFQAEPARVPLIETEDPADKALRDLIEPSKVCQPEISFEILRKNETKREKRKVIERTREFVNSKIKNNEKTISSTPESYAAPVPIIQEEQPDWNIVKTKKPIRKLVLASSLIARVIGRSGCNVNAIRDVTGTHIDIEKPKKGGGDRAITIRGNCDSTSMAYKLMEELIEHPDKEINEIIETNFPNKKHFQSIVKEKDDIESKISIEAALAAVQQNEKIQSEKQKQKEDEMRKKKEKDAIQKAKEEKENRLSGATACQSSIQKIVPGLTNPPFSTPNTPIRPHLTDSKGDKKDKNSENLEEQLTKHLKTLRRRDKERSSKVTDQSETPVQPPIIYHNEGDWPTGEPNRPIQPPGPIGPPPKKDSLTMSNPQSVVQPIRGMQILLSPGTQFEPPHEDKIHGNIPAIGNESKRRLIFPVEKEEVSPPPGLVRPTIDPSISTGLVPPIGARILHEDQPPHVSGATIISPIAPPTSKKPVVTVAPIQSTVPNLYTPMKSGGWEDDHPTLSWAPSGIDSFGPNRQPIGRVPENPPFSFGINSGYDNGSLGTIGHPDHSRNTHSQMYNGPSAIGSERRGNISSIGHIGGNPRYPMCRTPKIFSPMAPNAFSRASEMEMWNSNRNWQMNQRGWNQHYPNSTIDPRYSSNVTGGSGDATLQMRTDLQSGRILEPPFMYDQVQHSPRQYPASYTNPDSKSPSFHQRPAWELN